MRAGCCQGKSGFGDIFLDFGVGKDAGISKLDAVLVMVILRYPRVSGAVAQVVRSYVSLLRWAERLVEEKGKETEVRWWSSCRAMVGDEGAWAVGGITTTDESWPHSTMALP